MNTDTKIFCKILADVIYSYIKITISHYQIKFIHGVQSWSSIQKSIIITHCITCQRLKSTYLYQLMQNKHITKTQFSLTLKNTLKNKNIRGTFST